MSQTIAPFARPLYVMTKPVGAVCNLACDYCYYLEKANLYKDISKHVMSDELLEKFIREYIGSQTMPQVLFTWHGGETLMRPLSFYKRVMELQQKYAGGRTIDNCIQTNGTLLTDEWCEFFKKNTWLVGVSIDGPQEFHDEYRKNRQGRPSFTKVMQGIHLLKKHGVEWNALAVVNDFNADYPLDFYHFFKEIDCHYIQFTPIVERISPHADGRHLASPLQKDEKLADFSVSPEQWGNFLCTLFDEWVRQDVGNFFIQLFDSTLANWVGAQPGIEAASGIRGSGRRPAGSRPQRPGGSSPLIACLLSPKFDEDRHVQRQWDSQRDRQRALRLDRRRASRRALPAGNQSPARADSFGSFRAHGLPLPLLFGR